MTVSLTGPTTTPHAVAPSGVDGSSLLIAERDDQVNAAFRAVLDQQLDPADGPILRHRGKNDAHPSRDRESGHRSPTLDPTAAAVAELASPGPIKPVMAEARAIQARQGDSDGSRATTSSSGRSAPNASEPPRHDGDRGAVQPKTEPGAEPARAATLAPGASGQHQANTDSPTPAAVRGKSDQASAARGQAGPSAPQAQTQPRAAFGGVMRNISASSTSGAAGSNGPRIGGPTAKTLDARPGAKADKAQSPAPRFRLEPEDEKVAAQFGRGLAAALRQNGGTVTLRLQPEALGDLKIRMSVEPGKVGASFEVQTDQARQLLSKTMDTLRSALEARGLAVDRLDVQVADKAGGHMSPSHNGQSAAADGGTELGGGGAGPGSGEGSGSEHPERGVGGSGGVAGMPPEPSADAAEPTQGPWMGPEPGGALVAVRVRLDALA